MNCERIQNSFLDFEAGALPADEAAEVRAHLKGCPACQREWASIQEVVLKLAKLPVDEPSPRLRTQFYAMLDTHMNESETAHPFAWSRSKLDRLVEYVWPRRPLWQLGASLALVAVGVFVGVRTLPVSAEPDPAQAAQLAATQRELAELRTKVESVNQLVNYSLASQQPAQTRLKHVAAAMDQSGVDDRLLAELLNSLAFDPSTNVRLTALEALYTHAEQPAVRQGVLAALSRESSPLIQVAMIDFIASVRDANAAPVLEQLSRAPGADQSVRTAAQRALTLVQS